MMLLAGLSGGGTGPAGPLGEGGMSLTSDDRDLLWQLALQLAETVALREALTQIKNLPRDSAEWRPIASRALKGKE